MANTKTWPDPDTQVAQQGRADVHGVYLLSPSTQKAVEPAGGGGGAMTVADGADVAQGATTQAKATDGSATSWSVIQLLKGMLDKLLGSIAVTVAALPSATGAATVANSLPITNAAVQGWIAATGSGTATTDDALTFASQVRKVVLYNASAQAVPLEFDAAASATSFPLQPGQYMVFDDVLCTVVHVFPSATLPINTTSGLYVKGWK